MAARDIEAVLTELVRRANETTRRLRALEERDSNIEIRLGTVQDFVLKITEERKVTNESINERLTNIENDIIRINNELLRINKNIEKMAKRTELKELENILSIYSPIKTNFVTKGEVERMMEEK
jgi:hypothetical protein